MRAMDGSIVVPRIVTDGKFKIGQIFSYHTHPQDKYILQPARNGMRWQNLAIDHHSGDAEGLNGHSYELSLTHGRGMDGQLHLPVTPVTPL